MLCGISSVRLPHHIANFALRCAADRLSDVREERCTKTGAADYKLWAFILDAYAPQYMNFTFWFSGLRSVRLSD